MAGAEADALGVGFGALADGGVPRCCAARFPAIRNEIDQKNAQRLIRKSEKMGYMIVKAN
jgi:hypothetical protein